MLSRHAPIAIATLLFIGCGGSSSKPDGGGGSSAGGTGGSTSGAAGTGTGTGGNVGGSGGGGATGAAGAGNTGGAVPPPTGTMVFQGADAVLLDLGPPCTIEVGATGDRWCAFIGHSPVTPANAALFVVDVSKVATGTAVTCGGTDANCLKLTDSFGEDQFHAALFQGDTLVYYDGTMGIPFGWRPGMTAGRALAVAEAGADFNSCMPSAKGNSIWCIKDLPAAMQTDPNNLILSDLVAGHLDATATPPLVKIETVISLSMVDMIPHFQVDFPGAETIAWSARAAAGGTEVLKMQTLGNDASRVTVASGINSWSTSPDGTRWYWLSSVVEATGVGTLQSAPFPAGTSPITVGANTVQYGYPVPSSAALLVVDSARAMKFIADPTGAPTTSQSVDTGVLGYIALSAKGHPAYVKTTKTNALTGALTGIDLYVKKFDGTEACTITAATDAFPFDLAFTPSVGGLAWIQQTITSTSAVYTRISDCTKMTLGSNVVFTRPLGDRGILYLDGLDDVLGTATVKLRNLAADKGLAADPASVVSGGVGTLMVTAAGGADLLVYTVNLGGNSNSDGVYVRSFGP